MPRCSVSLWILLLCAACPPVSQAQLLADTLFTWHGYGQTSACRLQLYKTPPDEDRTHTVVLQELAENRGPSTVDDASYLAELIGRHLGIDPTAAYWVFHWGPFSYEGARDESDKELLLRATFRRTKSGTLGSPYWRVVTREEVEDYTDRHFR